MSFFDFSYFSLSQSICALFLFLYFSVYLCPFFTETTFYSLLECNCSLQFLRNRSIVSWKVAIDSPELLQQTPHMKRSFGAHEVRTHLGVHTRVHALSETRNLGGAGTWACAVMGTLPQVSTLTVRAHTAWACGHGCLCAILCAFASLNVHDVWDTEDPRC